jgi:hypothetical protein
MATKDRPARQRKGQVARVGTSTPQQPVPTGESVATSRGMGFLTAMTNALVRAVARSWRQSRKIRETFSMNVEHAN